MGAFLAALLVALGVGIGASVVLEKFQSTSDRTYTGAGARPDAEPSLSVDKPKPKS